MSRARFVACQLIYGCADLTSRTLPREPDTLSTPSRSSPASTRGWRRGRVVPTLVMHGRSSAKANSSHPRRAVSSREVVASTLGSFAVIGRILLFVALSDLTPSNLRSATMKIILETASCMSTANKCETTCRDFERSSRSPRRRGFTAAAAELRVTPSAVSQTVRAAARRVGVRYSRGPPQRRAHGGAESVPA